MRLTILYFDDEKMLLDLFQAMFGDQHQVRTAETLAEARRALAECDADVVISDQSMPEIEGTEFLREAAERCPDSFRILLTGQATVGDVIGDVSTGLIHLFEAKPWREERLQEVLLRANAVLERRRAHHRQT